jgi:hypothetical protein
MKQYLVRLGGNGFDWPGTGHFFEQMVKEKLVVSMLLSVQAIGVLQGAWLHLASSSISDLSPSYRISHRNQEEDKTASFLLYGRPSP